MTTTALATTALDKNSEAYHLYMAELNQALADELGAVTVKQQQQCCIFEQESEPAVLVSLTMTDSAGSVISQLALRLTSAYTTEGFALYRGYKFKSSSVELWLGTSTFDQVICVATQELRYKFWANRLAAKHGLPLPTFERRIDYVLPT